MNPIAKAVGVTALSIAGVGLGTWSAVSLHRMSKAHQAIAESGIDIGVGEDTFNKLTMDIGGGETEEEQPIAEDESHEEEVA